MMRILHTSDWHLGRTLHKINLHEAQASAMDQIVRVATDEKVDLVVVSGDVFDHAVPSAQALELLESTLARLTEVAPTVVTAGNHDSLRRLGYGSQLFTKRLCLRTRVEDIGKAEHFEDEHGRIHVYPIPYLHPDTARHLLSTPGADDVPATHTAVMRAAMQRVHEDLRAQADRGRCVVLAHAWVAGADPTDSERDVSVGGLGTVAPAVFEGVDYVALGHLHRPQEPTPPRGGCRLRYSGSPLRYSFSEAGHTKSVSIVDLDGHGVAGVREVTIEQPRPMANLRGLMSELLDPDLYGEHLDSWVSVVVTDQGRPSRMWPRIQRRFPHALLVRHEPGGGFVQGRPGPRHTQQKPSEVAGEFVKYVTNDEIGAAEELAFDAAVQTVRARESA